MVSKEQTGREYTIQIPQIMQDYADENLCYITTESFKEDAVSGYGVRTVKNVFLMKSIERCICCGYVPQLSKSNKFCSDRCKHNFRKEEISVFTWGSVADKLPLETSFKIFLKEKSK